MDSDSMTTRAAADSAHADDVVARLPYGVVVVEPGGLVSASNPSAHGYLPDLAEGAPTRCGELFDCMAPGGPCADGCLAERAAQSDTALPEIRIDTRRAGGVSALWVTAAPLGEGRALLHLRPGDARDRRRRSDPHWISGPQAADLGLRPDARGQRRGPAGRQVAPAAARPRAQVPRLRAQPRRPRRGDRRGALARRRARPR